MPVVATRELHLVFMEISQNVGPFNSKPVSFRQTAIARVSSRSLYGLQHQLGTHALSYPAQSPTKVATDKHDIIVPSEQDLSTRPSASNIEH